MDYKNLRYFITVVEEGTISGAAKKLYMAQPPLSNQMHKLEDELGCCLFERASKGIALTGAGKLLYERAKLIINNLEILKEEVIDYDKNHFGIVRIGMVSSVADTAISVQIANFVKGHPGVALDIFESNTYQTLERLNAGTLHFCIVRTPFVTTKFRQEHLASGHLVAVGKKELFDEDSETISLKNLSRKPLIIYRRWESIISSSFEKNQLPFHVVCRNDNARTTLFYAEQGLGIALMPASEMYLKNYDLIVRRIDGNPWETNIVLLYDNASYLPECAKDLRDFLLDNSMNAY